MDVNTQFIGKVIVTFAIVVPFQSVVSESKASMFHIESDGNCVVYDYPVNPDAKWITEFDDDPDSIEGISRNTTVKTYRWKDEQGFGTYGDAAPPDLERKALERGRRERTYRDEYGPCEPEERPSAEWRAQLFEAKARTTRLFLEDLGSRLANLEAAEYVPECEEALRARIEGTRQSIEQHQEDLRHFEAEAKRR